MVAVSDATPRDSHSFRFAWKPEEESRYRKQLTEMAVKALQPKSGTPVAAPPPATSLPKKTARTTGKASAKPITPPTPELQDIRVEALDLAFDNSPTIIFSAATTEEGAKPVKYVTLAARVEVDGDLRQIFSSTTASDRLDAIPRLELIDAVDAHGDGRGDLLFQKISDTGSTFILYRAGRDTLEKLFEGGDLP